MRSEGSAGWVVLLVAALGVAFSPLSGRSGAATPAAKAIATEKATTAPSATASQESVAPSANDQPTSAEGPCPRLPPLQTALWEAADPHACWYPAAEPPDSASLGELAEWLRDQNVEVAPVIVSVPDPDRGMALYYDQSIDALRHGAASLGLSQRGFSLVAGQGENTEPGFLVFRGGSKTSPRLVVALVTKESPVLGPDRPSLRRALSMATSLRAPEAPISVLGPFFSGSAGALGAELEATSTAGRKVRVVTGSATAGDLKERLPKEGPLSSFRRTVLTDRFAIQHLVRRLTALHVREPGARSDESLPTWLQKGAEWFENPKGISGKPNIALLHEFDTVFGAESGKEAELIEVSFPSSIAQLRREKMRSAPHGSKDDPLSLRRTLELKVAPSEEKRPDSPLPLSEVTPFSQELELAEELRRLCKLRVDYLILGATDPFDILFLADEVRSYCPRISLVLLGAEAIYRHPDLFASLSGALVVGGYPLLFDAPEWSASNQSFAFGSHVAQGFYNAWVTLVHELGPDSSTEPPLLGFSPIEGARGCDGPLGTASAEKDIPLAKRKPLWITKLRGGSFWPVDLECVPGADAVQRTQPSFKSDQRIRATGIARLVGFPILGGAFLVLLAGFLARLGKWRFPLASLFSPVDPELESLQRRYAFGGRLGLSVLLIATLPAAYTVAQSVEKGSWYYWAGASLALLCALLLAASAWSDGLGLFRSLLGRNRDDGRTDAWSRRLLAIPALVFGAGLARFGLAYPSGLARLPEIERKMALFRSFEPLGMSPLLPLGYLALGFCLWSFLGLTRIRAMTRFTLEDPLLLRTPERRGARPKGENDEAEPTQQTFPSESAPLATFTEVRWLLERAVSGPLRHYETLALIVLFVLGIYFIVRVRPTWEGASFDWLFRVAYSVLYGLVAISLVHFMALAALFSRFLRQLASLPMIEAYDRIAIKMTSSFGTQIGMRVPSFSELRVSRYSARLLANLARQAGGPTEGDAAPFVPLPCTPDASGESCSAEAPMDLEPKTKDAGPYAEVFQAAAPVLDACAAKVDAAFHETLEQGPDLRAQARGHTALYETSQALARVLHKLWEIRVERPDAQAAIAAIPAKDLLIGGSRSTVPMVAFYQAALPENVLHWTRMAEDFVALRVATFAGHVIFHMRALLSFAVGGSLLLILAGSHYPFEPSHFVAVFGWGLAATVILGGLVLIVRMEQNEILSRLGGSRPGRLDLSWSFFGRVLVYVGLPILAVVTNSFPELRDAIFSWVRPFAHFLP